MPRNAQIIARFSEFGQRLVGSEFGWQRRFAERLGVSPQQLSDILAGRSPIGAKIQDRARHLGCDIKWLLTGVEQDKSPPLPESDRKLLAILNEAGIRSEEALRNLIEQHKKLRDNLGSETFAAVLEVAAVREKQGRYKSRKRSHPPKKS